MINPASRNSAIIAMPAGAEPVSAVTVATLNGAVKLVARPARA